MVIAWASAARNPTRSTSTRVGPTSPVVSSTARNAVHVAVEVTTATMHLPFLATTAAVAACVRILPPDTDSYTASG